MRRKIALETGSYYHVFNGGAGKLNIFNNDKEFLRMILLIRYYRVAGNALSFGAFWESSRGNLQEMDKALSGCLGGGRVRIVAYCLMPTHVHFILQQIAENGVMDFMRLIQNSHARYFNLKYQRRGPLWAGRFGAKLIENSAVMLHVIRYVHLNPVTAYLVDDPLSWRFSSYKEFVGENTGRMTICEPEEWMKLTKLEFRDFTEGYVQQHRESRCGETPGV